MTYYTRLALVAGALTVAISAVGCGGTYPLSGKVAYDGKPVPMGEIILTPDPDGGNSGPGISITVEDGEYATTERGHVGGKYIARISGYEKAPDLPPPNGTAMKGAPLPPRLKPLFFNYTVRFELPSDSAEHDFDIPAQEPIPDVRPGEMRPDIPKKKN